jgi:hypothetical protein
MRNLLNATIVAGVLTMGAMGAAGLATAAVPAGPNDVTTTINGLKADGFDVIVNRVGTAPLSACSIGAVRPGHQVTRTDSGFPGDSLTTAVISKTVYVDLTC